MNVLFMLILNFLLKEERKQIKREKDKLRKRYLRRTMRMVRQDLMQAGIIQRTAAGGSQ